MTRLTLCLLASTALFAPSLAMADDPVTRFLDRAGAEIRETIAAIESGDQRRAARDDRDDDDRDDDDDDDDDRDDGRDDDDDDDGDDDSDDGDDDGDD